MKKFINKSRMIFIIIIIISLLSTLFGVYRPMKMEIESTLLKNFKLLAEAKTQVLKERINKSIQGANSLSSRTMIKKKIIEYNKNLITFDELVDFTTQKYLDGVNVLEDIKFAKRMVDNKEVCSVSKNDDINSNIIFNNKEVETQYILQNKNDDYCIKIISPILDNQTVIGYDYLIFDLNDTVDNLNTADIDFEIEKEVAIKKNTYSINNLYYDDNRVYYYETINNNMLLSVSISKDVLYERMDKITKKSGIYILCGYIIMMILMQFLIVNFAKKQINNISNDRDMYKDYASLDILTKAFSRLYLNQYVKKDGILVLIDLDGFKAINDKFGHSVGDEVLKTVVKIFKNSIRSEDAIIRYGGDEFIIIFNSQEIAKVQKVIERVQERLYKVEEFDFKISFSYGIATIEEDITLEKTIKEADMNMYVNKEKE